MPSRAKEKRRGGFGTSKGREVIHKEMEEQTLVSKCWLGHLEQGNTERTLVKGLPGSFLSIPSSSW